MRLKLGYDNHQDAVTKLTGTFCLYKGKAIVVNVVDSLNGDEGPFTVHGKYMDTGRPCAVFMIDDPEFNCFDYNIGYVNLMQAAAWFYRNPHKQWKQGLRHEQVNARSTSRYTDVQFRAGVPVAQMLENKYPTFRESVELLKQKHADIVAFHRNFACKYNGLHDDFMIEYKGQDVGVTRDAETFKMLPEFAHLTEALKEATHRYG